MWLYGSYYTRTKNTKLERTKFSLTIISLCCQLPEESHCESWQRLVRRRRSGRRGRQNLAAQEVQIRIRLQHSADNGGRSHPVQR